MDSITNSVTGDILTFEELSSLVLNKCKLRAFVVNVLSKFLTRFDLRKRRPI